jgi:methyl-accepting chemotaxis protein
MKLSIGAKVNTLIITALVMVGGSAVFFLVTGLNQSGKRAIEEYRQGILNEKQGQISDLVTSAFSIASERLEDSQNLDKLRKEYGDQLMAAVDQAVAVFASLSMDSDSLSEEGQKAMAAKIIEKMRWGKDRKGYFWIQDTDGTMVMHPIKPSLNGKPLLDLKDPDGKLFFREMDETAKRHGKGFVDYKWPKPGFDEPVDKISYIKLFEPWGWIIGTGEYLETTEDQIQKSALQSISAIRYGKDSGGYFFILNSKGDLILHPVKPELQGKNMLDTRDPSGKFLFREIIKTAEQKTEGGFVDYLWPKPGAESPEPKLSFARKLEGWDWIIGTGVYTDDIEKTVSQRAALIRKEISSQIVKTAAVVAGLILAALVVSYVVVFKGVVDPIKKIIAMLTDIAQGEGDLTRRITDTSGDETQELAEWFNRFIENIQMMISTVKQNTVKLAKASRDLAGISDDMNTMAQDTSDRSNTVASASEEMSGNLTSMAAAMEQTASNINMVSAATEEMSSTINEIARNTEMAREITQNAVDQTRSASEQVNELGISAKEIFNVVETITDISGQVNLLALNATIEAARAGEAGKGFAVVANEIKALANQTSNASNDIKARVTSIQSSTQGTVKLISGISDVVGEINDIVATIASAVEEQSVTTQEIAGNVSQASLGAGEVNENVAQSSLASQDISKEITQVTQATGSITVASGQVQSKAGDLSAMARDLSEMMSRFKV